MANIISIHKEMFFKKINSLFHSNQDPLQSLSQDEQENISNFDISLEALEKYISDNSDKRENDLLIFLKKSINDFKSAFQNLSPAQGQTERIRHIYERFIDVCILNSINSQIILQQNDLYNQLFKCLCVIGHQNNDKLPNAPKFVTFFHNLIKTTKSDCDCLKSSFELLTMLFKDPEFFNEFLEVDGISLVFTSVFLTNEKEPIDLMLNLLFCVVPTKFYVIISNTTVSLCIDSLKNEKDICNPKCAIFLANYISSYYLNDTDILVSFREDGNFLILNNFLKNHCEPKDAIEAYRIMMSKTENNPIVINSLYELYINSSSDFRTAILKYLFQNYILSINEVVPMTDWLFDIDAMEDEQISIITSVMPTVNFYEYIPFVLSILEKPNIKYETAKEFFSLLKFLVLSHKMPIDYIIDQKFLDNFILAPNASQLVNLINKFPDFQYLMHQIYISPKCEEYRFTIFSKLISCFSNDLSSFIQSLLDTEFSLEIFNLLLNNISNEEIANLLIHEIDEVPNSYELFLECNGLKIFNDFISTLINNLPIIKVIGALTKTGPKTQIDEWINSLPNDSPFFKEADVLKQIAINNDTLFLNVPSLLLYVETFNYESPLCLFNAGKYGIPMFLKRNIPIEKVPHLTYIVNRYVPPSIVNQLLDQIDKVDTFIDIKIPQLPLYEFIPISSISHSSKFKIPSKLVFKSYSPISSVKFDYFFPLQKDNSPNIHSKDKYSITILSCSMVTLIYFDNMFIFRSEKTSNNVSIYVPKGEMSTISLFFSPNEVEIQINNMIQRILKLEATHPSLPNEIAFGDEVNGLPLFISRNVYLNNQIARNFEITPTVYSVGYLGFGSYFSNMLELEYLFSTLERLNEIQVYSTLYVALLHIQKSNFQTIEQTVFWKRLLFSLKRSNKLIQNNILLFLHQLPSSIYNENTFAKFMINILNDYEIYFIFDQKNIISLLSIVDSYINLDNTHMDLNSDKNYNDSNLTLTQNLFIQERMAFKFINIMRSGVSDIIKNKLLFLIQILLKIDKNSTTLKDFFSYALTVGDWSLQLPLEIDQFPVNSLLALSIPESSLQCSFLDVFLNCVEFELQRQPYNELFNYNQLLEYSLMFDDFKRSLYFFKIIALYSQKNPKFIQHSQLSMFSFSRYSSERELWVISFAILAGYLPQNDKITKSPVINRPFFAATILAMLNKLISKHANKCIKNTPDQENSIDSMELCKEVMETMTRFNPTDFAYFSGNTSLLVQLSNFGLVPKSFLPSTSSTTISVSDSNPDFSILTPDAEPSIISEQSSLDDYSNASYINTSSSSPNKIGAIPSNESNETISLSEMRREINLDIHDISLTDTEIKALSDGSEIYKHPDIRNLKYKVQIDLSPFDIDGIEWTKSLPFDDLILFLSSVISSVDPSNFNNQFSLIAFGTSLMYASYSNYFVNEFISAVLIHYTQSDLMKSSPITVALKAAKCSVFANNYIHFLSLIASMMKRKFDPSVIKEFREIILLSLYFIPENHPERTDLEKIFESYKSILFHPAVLDDATFCHFLIINNISANFNPKYMDGFDSNEAESKWNDYLAMSIKPNYDFKSRINLSNQVISNIKVIATIGAKNALKAKIQRVANHYKISKKQINELATFLRKHEAFCFKFTKYKIHHVVKDSLDKDLKSYHLTSLCMPYSSPRVLNSSPYFIKSPPTGNKVTIDFFKLPNKAPPSKIPQVEFFGELQCAPEWCQEQSFYEYSYVLNGSDLISDFQLIFGKSTEIIQVYLYYYIHPIPCVLFYQNDKLCILLLATYKDNKLGLISEPHAPIALLPFNESVLLNEWHSSSLFCGHFVLSFEIERLLKVEPHLYVHQKRALSFFYLFDPNFILIFDSLNGYDTIKKKISNILGSNLSNTTLTNVAKGISCPQNFLFNLSINDCMKLWIERKISNYEYLLFLNYQSGRTFSDCAQYPIFPWVVSPSELEPRDLSLPMGQLSPKRAQHYDDTYEESAEPKYFYGCHYSLPGAVFWFMMRMPPFNFFLWDLNEGWDDSQRVFYSIHESYLSASSTNQTDLKEPIPEIFTVPELYVNGSNLTLDEDKNNVILPEWSNNNPFLLTEVFRKMLEQSEDINKWIDLIFGYKQTGEAALQAKNIFLPSAYHTSTAEFLNIDASAFEDQVINFGQCPSQIFNKEHPPRSKIHRNNIRFIAQKITEKSFELNFILTSSDNSINTISNQYIDFSNDSKLSINGLVLPQKSVIVPPYYSYYLSVDTNNEAVYVRKIDNNEIIFSVASFDFGFIRHISISDDGVFTALSLDSGLVYVYFIHYSQKIPHLFEQVSYFQGNSECVMSILSSNDFICISVFADGSIILWNFATKLIHKRLQLKNENREPIKNVLFDDFDGCLTVIFNHSIEQYTINGHFLRSFEFEKDEEITTAIIYPYDVAFDGRIIIVGKSTGSIDFLVANEENKLLKIGQKDIFKAPVKDIFKEISLSKIWLCDTKSHCVELTFYITEVLEYPLCPVCNSEMKNQCSSCGARLCPNCQGNVCPKCQNEMTLKYGFRLT